MVEEQRFVIFIYIMFLAHSLMYVECFVNLSIKSIHYK